MLETENRTDLILTAHGRRRARDRGMPYRSLYALLTAADRLVPVGGGCVALSASAAALMEARADGLPPSITDRLRNRVLVLDGEGQVVTALVRQGPRGRRYGRQPGGRPRQRSRGDRRGRI
jgi:hypothetical protein